MPPLPEPEFLSPSPVALPAPVAAWFRGRLGEPTLIQRTAWPAVAAGRNVLVSAPTGTGKTLAATLPLLVRLLDDEPAPASPWALRPALRGLYVAPLKALCNDVAR